MNKIENKMHHKEPCSFSVNDTTLQSSHPLRFRHNLFS